MSSELLGVFSDFFQILLEEVGLLNLQLREADHGLDSLVGFQVVEMGSDVFQNVVVDGGVFAVERNEFLQNFNDVSSHESSSVLGVGVDDFFEEGEVETVVIVDVSGGEGEDEFFVKVVVSLHNEVLGGFEQEIFVFGNVFGGEGKEDGQRVEDFDLVGGGEVFGQKSEVFFGFFFVGVSELGVGEVQNVGEVSGLQDDVSDGGEVLFVNGSGVFDLEGVEFQKHHGEHEFHLLVEFLLLVFHVNFEALFQEFSQLIVFEPGVLHDGGESVDVLQSDAVGLLGTPVGQVLQKSFEQKFVFDQRVHEILVVFQNEKQLFESHVGTFVQF